MNSGWLCPDAQTLLGSPAYSLQLTEASKRKKAVLDSLDKVSISVVIGRLIVLMRPKIKFAILDRAGGITL
jgi:hypothetical protein